MQSCTWLASLANVRNLSCRGDIVHHRSTFAKAFAINVVFLCRMQKLSHLHSVHYRFSVRTVQTIRLAFQLFYVFITKSLRSKPSLSTHSSLEVDAFNLCA